MSFKSTALLCVLILREFYLELSVIYIKVLNICLHIANKQAWNSGLARMVSLSQKQVTRASGKPHFSVSHVGDSVLQGCPEDQMTYALKMLSKQA